MFSLPSYGARFASTGVLISS